MKIRTLNKKIEIEASDILGFFLFLFREEIYWFYKVETKLGRWFTEEDKPKDLNFSGQH